MGCIVVWIDERICGWVGGGEADAAAGSWKQVQDADADYGAVHRDVHICERYLGGCVHWENLVVGAGWEEVRMIVGNGVFGKVELEGGLHDRNRC